MTLTATTIDSVAAFLAARLGVDKLTVTTMEALPTGHTGENWIVDASWMSQGESVKRRILLRRQSEGKAWDNPRVPEFRLLRTLGDRTAVPVPRALWLEDTGRVFERPFLVEEWVDGTVDYRVFADPRQPVHPQLRLFGEFTAILARIHSVDWRALNLEFLVHPALPITDAFNPATFQLERIVARFKNLGDRFAPTQIVHDAFQWLAKNRQLPRQLSLVHGDYGPHNAVMRDEHVAAIIDWEFATISDPVQDLAWFTLRGRSIRDNFAQNYYRTADFHNDYERLTGYRTDEDAIRWWQVYGVCRTVVGRAHQGIDIANANRAAAESARRAGPLRPVAEDERLLTELLAVT